MEIGPQIDFRRDRRHRRRAMEPALVFAGRGAIEARKNWRQIDLPAVNGRRSLGAIVVAPRRAGMKSKEGRALREAVTASLGLESWR